VNVNPAAELAWSEWDAPEPYKWEHHDAFIAGWLHRDRQLPGATEWADAAWRLQSWIRSGFDLAGICVVCGLAQHASDCPWPGFRPLLDRDQFRKSEADRRASEQDLSAPPLEMSRDRQARDRSPGDALPHGR
jgi:hypothetical protein